MYVTELTISASYCIWLSHVTPFTEVVQFDYPLLILLKLSLHCFLLFSLMFVLFFFFFFSSRRRHTRLTCDWSSDVCSSDSHLHPREGVLERRQPGRVRGRPGARAQAFRHREVPAGVHAAGGPGQTLDL